MISSFKIVTLFPELFGPLLATRLFERAKAKVSIDFVNPRDFAKDKRRTVDDTPYGGGCGMLLKPEPLSSAIEDIVKNEKGPRRIIFLTPQGKVFDQRCASRLSKVKEIVLVCGRYEGIDQRVVDLYADEELSIGDFVLSGGEIAAMAVMESVLRLLPGVLGNEESSRRESFAEGLLEYAQYTRPESFKGLKVPEILLSGDHRKIADWRKRESEARTKKRRPDLYAKLAKKR